jgi:hypothetical protein
VALLCRVEASANSTAVKGNIRPNSQATRILKLWSGLQLPIKYENGPWKARIAMYIFTASDLTRKESRDRSPVTSQGFLTLIPRQVTAFPIFADKLLTVEQSHKHEFQGQNIYHNSSTGPWIALPRAGFRYPTWSVMGKSSRVIKYALTFIVVRLDFDNDFFLDITMGIDMDFGDFTRQLYQSSSPIFTEMSPRPGRFIT